MENVHSLADQALDLLHQNIDKNYRVLIGIVGAPGSGKSTIAERLQDEINERYYEYLKSHDITETHVKELKEDIHLVDDLAEADAKTREEIDDGFYSHVEDTSFKPVKISNEDGSITVVGRGGKDNAFKIRTKHNISTLSVAKPAIAQTVVMDGFHLSRKHLDCFRDPEMAHRRRGSPPTFDSNNFLELCRVLCKTCTVHDDNNSSSSEKMSRTPPVKDDLFAKVTSSFVNVPEVVFPGFDHALKDPTPEQHSVPNYTRIVIIEGLYLLLDQENWSHIYENIASTDAYLLWNIVTDEKVIEQRVAKRHVKAGICSTIKEGIERFRSNDLLNGRLIQSKSLRDKIPDKQNHIIDIRND
ncbi:ATP-dependent kinase YFH7 [Kluyveromyces marxianus]